MQLLLCLSQPTMGCLKAWNLAHCSIGEEAEKCKRVEAAPFGVMCPWSVKMCISSNHGRKMDLIGKSLCRIPPFSQADSRQLGLIASQALQGSMGENLLSSVLKILREGSGLCTHKVPVSLLMDVRKI